MKATNFQSSLKNYCETLIAEFSKLSKERKNLLEKLGAYIANKVHENKNIKLIVICTHNSRRSHIGQLCLQAAGEWYDIPKLNTFSGGTEATAFNKNAVAALQSAGFEIIEKSSGKNPIYEATIDIKDSISKELFSKTFDSSTNPQKDFAAIMVCTEADAGCPFVLGADARFAIPFEDPKRFDGMENEAEEYSKTVRQIGTAFFYAIYCASEILK